MPTPVSTFKKFKNQAVAYIWIAIGAFLAAVAIRIFLLPNQLIDGGIVGIGLILARLYGENYLPTFLILLNLPFLFLAYRYIRQTFVLHMMVAVLLFAGFLFIVRAAPSFLADPLEVIVIGGAILGIGVGLIIRH